MDMARRLHSPVPTLLTQQDTRDRDSAPQFQTLQKKAVNSEQKEESPATRQEPPTA